MSYLTKLFNLTHLYSSDLCNSLISGLHNFNKSTNFSLIQLTKSNFFEWSFFYFNFGTSWSNRFWNRVICFCLFDHCFFFFSTNRYNLYNCEACIFPNFGCTQSSQGTKFGFSSTLLQFSVNMYIKYQAKSWQNLQYFYKPIQNFNFIPVRAVG